jgi:hypothetical protein
MNPKAFRIPLILIALAICFSLLACGGGNNSASSEQDGTLNMVLSDDATQDWATIGVKVLSVTLTPQGGGNPVTVYTAPTPAPFVNLVQLDQLGEIIGNASIPAGTYNQATITISGNPSDILLVGSPSPEPGFPVLSPLQVPSSQIQVIGATGSPLTVPLTLTLSPALSVGAGSSNALDLEFDLAHPAFIVQHVAPAGTFWAINLNPATVRHHPIRDITQLTLRHLYGTVTDVPSASSFTMTKCFPAVPATSNETCLPSTQSLQILADATNGTIFWNLDTSPATRSVITNFSSVASTFSGQFVRVQARYQQNGTLVAVRVWASSSFSKVFVSPEGHVVDVNRTATPPTFTILNEDGTISNPITVNSSTQFFFGSQAITPTGTGFLTNTRNSFVRGFKVHVNPVDPSASPLVADTVNIEIARYAGTISGASPTAGFSYNRAFPTPYTLDDYTIQLPYISNSTTNGEDNNGSPISGFKWWYFALPTGTLDYGSNASADFVSAVGGTVNYGSSCTTSLFTTALGSQAVTGMSYANWNDPASPNSWSAYWAILLPSPAPLSTSGNANGTSFSMTPIGTGCLAVPVDLSNTPGQASLVYQVNRNSANIITVTSLDITQTNNLNTLDTALNTTGTYVKAFGVPEAAGRLKAYVLFYYTVGGGNVQPNQ